MVGVFQNFGFVSFDNADAVAKAISEKVGSRFCASERFVLVLIAHDKMLVTCCLSQLSYHICVH